MKQVLYSLCGHNFRSVANKVDNETIPKTEMT